MRTVTMVVRGATATLLVAVAASGCAAQEASSPERVDIPGQPATATRTPEVEGLAPGAQRDPGPPTVTTVRPRWPVGKTSAPAVTTTSTAPPTTTTTTITPSTDGP